MPTSSSNAAGFEALAKRLRPDARLRAVRVLEGGVSAETTLLDIEQPDGRIEELVVRRHGSRDLDANPNVAGDEYRLLTCLYASGLAVPEPYYVDEIGTILGSPCIVIAFVDGTDTIEAGNLNDSLAQMAVFLADLHRLDGNDPALSFLPDPQRTVATALVNPPERLDGSLSEGLIREALLASWPPKREQERSVLHGDYWPGNVLWRGGKLAAVIDWEDAGAGDPLADVANARLEILWQHGVNAMETFSACYQQKSGSDFNALPLWDLYAALRPCSKLGTWGLQPDELREMQEHHADFVRQAIAALR